jgi:hypothetical protein
MTDVGLNHISFNCFIHSFQIYRDVRNRFAVVVSPVAISR